MKFDGDFSGIAFFDCEGAGDKLSKFPKKSIFAGFSCDFFDAASACVFGASTSVVGALSRV